MARELVRDLMHRSRGRPDPQVVWAPWWTRLTRAVSRWTRATGGRAPSRSCGACFYAAAHHDTKPGDLSLVHRWVATQDLKEPLSLLAWLKTPAATM
ncbi:MAG: hypothetical protein J2P45_11680 [Candidatus Dormibacteraeota bacterium]|nr:hypothetical protein [Candidatus Dormibacteraeota bacterium]